MIELERPLGDLGGQRLQQLARLAFDHFFRDRPQARVIDGVRQPVAASGFAELGFDFDVDPKLLRLLALVRAHSVLALERHAEELDPIHDANCEKYTVRVINAKVDVRPAADKDLEAINDIYNQYVVETHITFDVEPMTLDERREWFTHYATTGRHRVLVAVDGGQVVGFSSSSRYRPKPGYVTSVETSIYLAPDEVGKGAGAKLYGELFQALEGEDIHRVYAGIALPNPASIALHERFGFKRVAVYTEQGRKFERYWDVAWYEKPFGAEP
jgi:phosphinothricin acetyltransferase